MAQKVLLLVGVPIVFEVAFVLLLSGLLAQSERYRKEEFRARQVYTHTVNILLSLMEAGTVTVIRGLSEKSGIANQYQVTKKDAMDRTRVQAEMALIHKLTAGHPKEEKIMGEIDEIIKSYESRFYKNDAIFHGRDTLRTVQEFKEIRRLINQFLKCAAEMKDVVIVIQDQKSAQLAQAQHNIMLVLTGGVVLNILLGLGLAGYFNRSTTSRFKILTDNTQKLAKGDKLNDPIGGDDEITRLDDFFRRMAADLEESARKERAIVDNALDVICSLDEKGNFLKVNDAANQAWGFPPAEMSGKNWKFVVAEESQNAMDAFLNRVKDGHQSRGIELAGNRQDGRQIYMTWSVFWSEQDRTFFCVVHDVSERKEIENLKKDFVAMVSHDLRAPLTSISASLSLLSSDKRCGELSAIGSEKLNVANRNIDRLIKLVNDLLDIEKLESGQMQLELEEIDMADVVERAVFAIESAASSAGVEIDPLPGSSIVLADQDRLIQVAINLLSNAIKFSPEGAKVTLKIVDHSDYGEIQVIDQGRGIPADKIDAVFERFKQVTIEDSKKRGGSGLGLAICRSIVDNHGGKIGVESQEGKGSTFWFHIPKGRSKLDVIITDAVKEETSA